MSSKYLPISYTNKKDRFQTIEGIKNLGLRKIDIESFVEGRAGHIALPSGDYMFFNEAQQVSAFKNNINDIATAILGDIVYGPVVIAERKDIHIENLN